MLRGQEGTKGLGAFESKKWRRQSERGLRPRLKEKKEIDEKVRLGGDIYRKVRVLTL